MAFTFVDPNNIPDESLAGDGLSPGLQMFAATTAIDFMEATMAVDLVVNNSQNAQKFWSPA